MPWIVHNLWLIPALPVLAAGVSALLPQRCRKSSATLAIGFMLLAFLLSLCAFAHVLKFGHHGEAARQVFNFPWLQFAAGHEGILKLGWVLDPLAAVMLVMVSFVGLLIFIYSVGYMAHDENFTRFFCFMSLFAGAMLGLVIANSLLLLFICWELVGLTSYLLIGFWYHKPSAAAAAKKAFITTRIGDLALLLGMVWLYSQTGTLLFYDNGAGCLEQSALARLVAETTSVGMAVSTAIGLLIFAGAVGKSGQVPLHVWLPDAMEGPTPVSALIHAATMVAAGVFLVARVYPLMAAMPESVAQASSLRVDAASLPRVGRVVAAEVTRLSNPALVASAEQTLTPSLSLSERERGIRFQRGNNIEASGIGPAVETVPPLPGGEGGRRADRGVRIQSNQPRLPVSLALQVVTWIGAITAVFAASIAVAQNDIKRILAYSTISQLGYMMMGLGVGGVAVGMFHLITHAFFKALLFMGAGSVIHGCHDEQDIRHMGGLRKFMPVTFATYAVGMLALCGFPLLFSGFWSKDEILHAAHGWPVSHGPFYLGLFGALLTAFYMTRQVVIVFYGDHRGCARQSAADQSAVNPPSHHGRVQPRSDERSHGMPHESSAVMTAPLMVLAMFAVLLGFIGTPVWPWFQSFLEGRHVEMRFDTGVVSIMLHSSLVVFAGLGLGWWLYGRKPVAKADAPDVLEKLPAGVYVWLQRKFGIDELYEKTVIAFNAWCAKVCAFFDEWVWGGVVMLVSYLVLGLSWVNSAVDQFVINHGFDQSCRRVTDGGRLMSRLQDGRVQNYLRVIGVALVALVLILIWGGGK